LKAAYYLLIFIAVLSVAVLAAYLYGTIIGPENVRVLKRLLSAAWIVAGLSLVLTSLTEIALNGIGTGSAKEPEATP